MRSELALNTKIKLSNLRKNYLLLLIFFLFFSGYITNFIPISGINFGSSLFDAFLCIGFLAASYRQIRSKIKMNYAFVLSIIIGVGTILLAFFNSPNFNNSFSGIRNHFLYLFLWWVVYVLVDPQDLVYLYKKLVQWSLFISFYAIFQALFFRFLPEIFLNIKGVADFSIAGVTSYRCNGLVGDMLTFGGFAIITYLLTFSYIYIFNCNSNNKITKTNYICLIVPVVASLFTYSRASIFGMVVTVFISFMYVERKFKKKIVVLVGIILCGVFVLLFTNTGKSVLERFTNSKINSSSDDIRYSQYRDAISNIRDNFFLGIGMGTQIGNRDRIVTDGYWLTCLLEMGVPLFLVYFVFFSYTLLLSFKEMVKRNVNTFFISVLYFFSMIYFFVFSFINSSLEVRVNLCTIMILYGIFVKVKENPAVIPYFKKKEAIK